MDLESAKRVALEEYKDELDKSLKILTVVKKLKNPNHWKTMTNPASSIKLVVGAIHVLFGGKNDSDWAESRKTIASNHILDQLKQYDKDQMPLKVLVTTLQLR
jgi:hypothetical protein